MADRIKALTGKDSSGAVSRKLALRGVTVSPQAVDKWWKGGQISEENLIALCAEYGRTPAWVRYGIEDVLLTGEAKRILRAMEHMPKYRVRALVKTAETFAEDDDPPKTGTG